MRLSEYAFDEFSQFGEDGIIERIFQVIGASSRFCVEFGAADGTSCSNTKRLRDAGWSALLIEADPVRADTLAAEASARVECHLATVTPDNIDGFIGTRPVDFMSIDVDGDDYAIFAGMSCRPRVVCIEYNASIPPHISLRQARVGGRLGQSARALCELADSKGYGLVAVTKGNLLFVRDDRIMRFLQYERDLDVLFDTAGLAYLATDYDGRPLVVGASPPWGLSDVPFVDDVHGDYLTPITRRPDVLRGGFEEIYGPATFLPHFATEVPGEFSEMFMQWLIRQIQPQALLLDISGFGPTADFAWIVESARREDYTAHIIPSGVIALTPRST